MIPNILNRSAERVPKAFLLSWIRAVERELAREKVKLPKKNLELTILFLEEKAGRELNKTYRGKNYATDVLSFDGDGAESIGELAIVPQVIKRQAKEHGLLYREELGYMVLHGILHLLGYDHEKSKREASRMMALQDRIFERLCAKF